MRGHGVLVRFDAASGTVRDAVGAQGDLVVGVVGGGREERVPAQGQVGR